MRPLAFLLAATLPLAAQNPPPRPAAPAGQHMAEVLGLSPDQQAELKAIREKHQAALKADHDATRAQAEAFHRAMQDPKASEAQLRQAFDQMNAQRFRALLDRRALRQEMRAVLTPDQQAKAEAMRAAFHDRMKARMAERRQRWMDRQGPDQQGTENH